MGEIADFIKASLVPGSIRFLGFGLVAGVVFLYGSPAVAKWARRWLVFLTLGYGFLSTPLGASVMSAPLVPHFSQIATPQDANDANTVVVLSNGGGVYCANGQAVAEPGKSSAYNALEAARIVRIVKSPIVIVSGGSLAREVPALTASEVLADTLVKLGVPAGSIERESRSQTTREQALFVADLLRTRHTHDFILVTAPTHMPRAVAAFRRLGLNPIPSAPEFRVATPGFFNQLLPSLSDLIQSDRVSYEYMARLYYWINGWTG